MATAFNNPHACSQEAQLSDSYPLAPSFSLSHLTYARLLAIIYCLQTLTKQNKNPLGKLFITWFSCQTRFFTRANTYICIHTNTHVHMYVYIYCNIACMYIWLKSWCTFLLLSFYICLDWKNKCFFFLNDGSKMCWVLHINVKRQVLPLKNLQLK